MHFQLWDASTGQEFSQFTEHEKRAWSVDFSVVCPTKFASGSDDCTVKLWSISEVNSLFNLQTHTCTVHIHVSMWMCRFCLSSNGKEETN